MNKREESKEMGGRKNMHRTLAIIGSSVVSHQGKSIAVCDQLCICCCWSLFLFFLVRV